MLPRLAPYRLWMLGTLAILAASGCVERRMVIITDPPGAIVYDEKNQPLGGGPVDKPFVYYGKYSFRLAKDGYETQVVEQPVAAPWYEFPGLDFVSENLIPWTIRDVRYYRYVMQPSSVQSQVMTPDVLLKQAQQLREYSATKGTPLPPDLNPRVGAPPGIFPPPGQ
jgi:hypothetical protein